MKHSAKVKQQSPVIDPSIEKLLKESGFRVEMDPRPDGEAHERVKAHSSDGAVTYSKSRTGDVVAIARGDHRKRKEPRKYANGTLIEGHVVELNDKHLEFFPSDIDSAAVTLTRDLTEDSCLRFARSRSCSMAGGNILLEIQQLWRRMMPAMGVLVMEFTGGTGDADNAKVLAIDAASRLRVYSSRTSKKRWQYITKMALQGMHIPEIAQSHHVTVALIRKEMQKGLDQIAKVGKGT